PTMSEREPKPPRTHEDSPLSVSGREEGGVNSDPREERLRALYRAVYPPSYPSVKPSDELRRRVGEVMAQSDTRAARRGPCWWPRPVRPVPTVGVAAAVVLIAAVGLALVQRGQDRSTALSTPLSVARPSPGRATDRPLSASPRRGDDPGRR